MTEQSVKPTALNSMKTEFTIWWDHHQKKLFIADPISSIVVYDDLKIEKIHGDDGSFAEVFWLTLDKDAQKNVIESFKDAFMV